MFFALPQASKCGALGGTLRCDTWTECAINRNHGLQCKHQDVDCDCLTTAQMANSGALYTPFADTSLSDRVIVPVSSNVYLVFRRRVASLLDRPVWNRTGCSNTGIPWSCIA